MQEIRGLKFNRAVAPSDAANLNIETIDTGDASKKLNIETIDTGDASKKLNIETIDTGDASKKLNEQFEKNSGV